MKDLRAVIGDYDKFLDDILGRVEAEGFDFGDFVQLDHLCFRTDSRESYDQKKSELSEIATLLDEAMIADRPIATFKLHQPIRHGNWRIDAVELPAPREGRANIQGLEHIEFVIYDDFDAFLKKYPNKPFNKDAIDRGVNPDVFLQFDGCAVKFHLLNLPTAVYLQKKLGMRNIKGA